LSENRELLDRMAAALLERETLDRDDVDLVVAGKAAAAAAAASPADAGAHAGLPGETGVRSHAAPGAGNSTARTVRRVNARRLAAHSPRAVRDALLRHGWDAVKADAAAGSLDPVVVLLEDLAPETIEALVRHNRQLGLDLLTGEGWVLLAGSRSRLGVFARPWTLPAELVDLGTAVGQALPSTRRSSGTPRGSPFGWTTRSCSAS
jgi:hypothetical protein